MPVHTVDEILANIIQNGFANPSRYRVDIYRNTPLNGSLVGVNNAATQSQGFRNFSINCEMATLPGVGVTTSDRRYYGPTRKMPYNILHNDLNLSFYCSEDHRERKYFDAWVEQIANMDNFDIGFYDEYVSTIKVVNFDNSNRVALEMEIYEAYPLSVTPIDLGYSNMSTQAKVMVNFAYYKYKKLSGSNAISQVPLPPTP